jgi:GTP-binding protein
VGGRVARISAVPGKTRTLNFYELKPVGLRLVDLPGFGYAAVPHQMRRLWQPAVEGYLKKRKGLRGVLCVVDIRRGLQDEEHDLLAFLAHHGLPLAVVLTKADKLKANDRRKMVQAVKGELAAEPIVFSARTGEGKELVWRVVVEMAQGADERS